MSNKENAQIFYNKFSFEVEKRIVTNRRYKVQKGGLWQERGCFVLGFWFFFKIKVLEYV